MTRTTRAALAAALLTTTLALTACGGGTTPPADAEPTPPPVVGEVTPAPIDGEIPDGALPSFDLDALTGTIPGVDSYRTSVATNGVTQYESVVVTKPEVSKAITTFNDDGTVSDRYIVIGDKVWSSGGPDEPFEAVPSALASSLMMAFDPAMMLGAFAGVDWAPSAADQGVEDKNGIQARHLKIDPTTIAGLGAQMPAGAAIDVWVAQDGGYIVGWEMSGFEPGQSMAIEVMGVNDPANVVEAPPS